MKLNEDKCHFSISGSIHEHLWIKVGSELIYESLDERLLGVIIDKSLNFNSHLKTLSKKNPKFLEYSKPIKLSGMYDWDTLRDKIKKFGVRNSLSVALMPTASTSQIMGNTESFEPCTSNLYRRKTSSGQFMCVNKYLIHEL